MQSRESILHYDKEYVWHPYTQMKDYKESNPIVAVRAEGSFFWDANGARYIDGNSSWWTAGLGHKHPRLVRAAKEQLDTMAHIALAGIAHPEASLLAKELVETMPKGLSHVFYTDNGSTAIEAAMKMALQFFINSNRPQKRRFLAFDGAFHGDTLGAASLGGVAIFRKPFASVLLDCIHVPFPEQNAFEQAFESLKTIMNDAHEEIAAIVIEPLVQGASGMRMYPASFLHELARLAAKHEILLIADEVFTGYGRTGTMWATEQANIVPDFMCLGKTFSSIIPMGAVLTKRFIFESFLGEKTKSFLYGHTFCGNPLGARIAREVLAIYREENILQEIEVRAKTIKLFFEQFKDHKAASSTRSLGMIGAVDLKGHHGYLGEEGWRVYEEAKKRGAYLRPLGNTVYVTPPYTIPIETLKELLCILHESIDAVFA